MNQQQLQARLFILTAHHGVKFALSFTQDIMQRYSDQSWVICCGAEMLLAKQLPERAQSRQEQQEQRRARLFEERAVPWLNNPENW